MFTSMQHSPLRKVATHHLWNHQAGSRTKLVSQSDRHEWLGCVKTISPEESRSNLYRILEDLGRFLNTSMQKMVTILTQPISSDPLPESRTRITWSAPWSMLAHTKTPTVCILRISVTSWLEACHLDDCSILSALTKWSCSYKTWLVGKVTLVHLYEAE